MKTKAVKVVVAALVLVAFWAVVAGRFVPHSHDTGRSWHSHDAGGTYHAH